MYLDAFPYFPYSLVFYMGPNTQYQTPDLRSRVQGKSERAGSGTLIHPIWDKIGTKWVAIKDFGAFPGVPGVSKRRESFSRGPDPFLDHKKSTKSQYW